MPPVSLTEANFDGIVGPTHNYAGLSPGNVASGSNAGSTSSPKRAALQGLAKAKSLADEGRLQFVLPPQHRPNLALLASVGFTGDTAIQDAALHAPFFFAAACSSSFMWAANAATVAPSADTRDQRLHLTPANLISNIHRTIEAPETTRLLRSIFSDTSRFVIHDPLPSSIAFSDEGAANHTRLYTDHAACHFFVYGHDQDSALRPSKFPTRQTLLASQTIARLHQLDPAHCVFAQQSPEAIDAGVFHNDVISVGNADHLLMHEKAFSNNDQAIADITQALGRKPRVRIITQDEVPLEDAVASYLLNGQLLGDPGQPQTLLCPKECEATPSVRKILTTLVEEGFLAEARIMDLRESMRNGGGPACLRLRVPMTETEVAAITARLRLDQSLYDDLVAWVNTHYRDELSPADLADPALANESHIALNNLAEILELRSLTHKP